VNLEAIFGISIEKSWQLLACVLGVLKSGHAFYTLDPSISVRQIAHILPYFI
jgi:hypothetical protein